MNTEKIKPINRQKRSFTYFLPDHDISLEYLTKYCENIRTSKVNIVEEALTDVLLKNKYKKELETPRFQKFKKDFGSPFENKKKK